MRSTTSLPTTENFCCILFQENPKVLAVKRTGGCRVHSVFLYHNHYVRSIKHCLYAARPQWLLLHQSSFTTWVFFFQIYSSQGQGDNNSYTLITPNYLFLPQPQLSARVICYLGFSQPPFALSTQLHSKVFEENSCGFLQYSQCKVQPKLNYSHYEFWHVLCVKYEGLLLNLANS